MQDESFAFPPVASRHLAYQNRRGSHRRLMKVRGRSVGVRGAGHPAETQKAPRGLCGGAFCQACSAATKVRQRVNQDETGQQRWNVGRA
ncbi:hypothetical protein ELH90_23100 [Rhizobium leguminosarum]|uniref:Uncharacterized protein n=1 Tax=Rhizobium leguminosarum TaxID=384 RepID=A0A7M3E058_RHILE|nr:hypothetical protein ELH90_23100 [Rhizobium leguminosarum]